MIEDFLNRLSALCTNGVINNDEYTTIYDIMMGAKDRKTLNKNAELCDKLNEQYTGKLAYENIGGHYHSFGYPRFKAESDRIYMTLKPYFSYNKDNQKVETKCKNYDYRVIWERDLDSNIKPITMDEMEDMLKNFEGVNVEYVIDKFKK